MDTRSTEDVSFSLDIQNIYHDADVTIFRGVLAIDSTDPLPPGVDERIEHAVVTMEKNRLSPEEFAMCRTAMVGDEIYGNVAFSATGPKSFIGNNVLWVEPMKRAAE